MDREIAEKWIREFNQPLMEINHILRKMNDEGIKPEIHVFQDPKRLGEGLQQIEVSMFPSPHYSEWTKLHIDFCRRFPSASVFKKIWYPTSVLVVGSIQMWWDINVKIRFWNSKLRHKLGLKHPSDGDC